MIFITVVNDAGEEYIFQYKGDIEICRDDPFITITAISHDDNWDHLYTWDKKVYDKFWFDTIVNIEGVK